MLKSINILLFLLVTFSLQQFQQNISPLDPGLVSRFKNSRMIYPQFESVFRGKGMVRAELMEIYRICDLNNDGVVDQKEYKLFHDWFIKPFSDCDLNKDWQITSDEAGACQAKQAWFTSLATANLGAILKGMAPHEGKTEQIPPAWDLFNAVDRNKDGQIDLSEYIFLRKIAAAWRKCVTGYGMNQQELRCALAVTGSAPKINEGDARRITLMALTWMTLGTKRIGFMVFAHISEYYNLFVKFCYPAYDCHLNKATVKKHIELQTLTNSLTPLRAEFINVFFDQFSHKSVAFPDFMIMQFWIDKYVEYSGKDAELEQLEFLRLISDRTISPYLRNSIDQITSPIAPKYQKQAIIAIEGPLAAMAAGGMGGRSASSIDMPEVQAVDEMTFFGKSSMFMQKRSSLRSGKKQLFNYQNLDRKLTALPESSLFKGPKTTERTNLINSQNRFQAEQPAVNIAFNKSLLGDNPVVVPVSAGGSSGGGNGGGNNMKLDPENGADEEAAPLDKASAQKEVNSTAVEADQFSLAQKVMAPEVTVETANPSRLIMFNIMDTDMNGSLSMEEFFIFLKHNVIFSALAGAQEKPSQYAITKQIYYRNKESVTQFINTFPNKWEESCMAMLEGLLLDNEINLKEFSLIFLAGRTFLRQATQEPGSVTLTDIMVNAKRWDLFTLRPKTFVHLLSQGNTSPRGQTPTQNYNLALHIMLKLEINAVKMARNDAHKQMQGLDMGEYELAERKEQI